ncbi:TonB-dependent receptor [Ponticaulis sp.]|uniref:TonB-dependent receptor plug domain-containing protein n=1 Tax=Ponticaulis sp. TaxID=2020902 RepID=UPI000B7155F6|nr:TonB-dependent receptor [Ponticaulis sp.]RPG17369.1 MAG: hypothetical protein CBC85_005235 [Hyphomonadaceae bacterium TMED125]HBH88702.1 hypothetical protein [Hyphomonadaceae bacterium]MAJ08663.1 hypothetical protein [Ponticaulis sp.]MAJ09951.1 hypothetical protein [Ponticaulis sp.]RPG18560.1 MAG: hypothetical protein CBC85_002250 [Hyphomonadaceae bacterium TMED125]|tara:strand:- start:3268 stop:5244 length:1977 start_codon:yes stop_codon:yes gene_type:complete
MPTFKKNTSILALSAIVAFGLPATAQSIDYGSLEMLFDEPVTTSATGAPQRSTDAPVTMEIISADEIRSSGARQLTDLLARVPGLEVRNTSSVTGEVSIRGYNGPKTPRLLVLVNGRQVFNDSYNEVNWAAIPVQMEEIRQIEIVKGPNTALFGFNAVSGVINIITFSPFYDDADSMTVRVDNEGSLQGGGVVSFHPTENVGVRASLGGWSIAEFEDLPLDPRTGSNPRNENFAFGVEAGIQLSSSTQLSLETTRSEVYRLERTPVSTDTLVDITTSSYRSRLVHDGDFGLISGDVYYNESTAEYGLLTTTPTTVETSLLSARVEDLFKVGTDHTFRVAGEYRSGESTINSTLTPLITTEVTVMSLSGMWNWAVNDKVSTTLAVRVDSMDRQSDTFAQFFFGGSALDDDATEFSYNAGLVWKPTAESTFRFQAARGLQVPSFSMLSIAANPETSVVNNYSVDYDRALSGINGQARFSVFYQENLDMTSLAMQPIMPGLGVPTGPNFGDSETKGIEVSLEGEIGSHIDWQASWLYQDTTNSFAPIVSFVGVADVMDFGGSNADNVFKVGAQYENGSWSFGAWSRYISEYEIIDAFDAFNYDYQRYEIGGYVATDLRLAYQASNDIVFALDATNLTNDDEAQMPFSGMDSRLMLSISADF